MCMHAHLHVCARARACVCHGVCAFAFVRPRARVCACMCARSQPLANACASARTDAHVRARAAAQGPFGPCSRGDGGSSRPALGPGRLGPEFDGPGVCGRVRPAGRARRVRSSRGWLGLALQNFGGLPADLSQFWRAFPRKLLSSASASPAPWRPPAVLSESGSDAAGRQPAGRLRKWTSRSDHRESRRPAGPQFCRPAVPLQLRRHLPPVVAAAAAAAGAASKGRQATVLSHTGRLPLERALRAERAGALLGSRVTSVPVAAPRQALSFGSM